MKTLSALIVGGALTLGTAMAQNAPKPATSVAPAAQNQTTAPAQTKVKKHRKHHKTGATATTAKPATPSTTAPANVAPKK